MREELDFSPHFPEMVTAVPHTVLPTPSGPNPPRVRHTQLLHIPAPYVPPPLLLCARAFGWASFLSTLG
jgi:hypothetical protein